jgi:hypothetical protein
MASDPAFATDGVMRDSRRLPELVADRALEGIVPRIRSPQLPLLPPCFGHTTVACVRYEAG